MKLFPPWLRFDAGCAVILGLPLAVWLLFSGFCWYSMNALPVSSRALGQIVPGMPSSNVEQLLGPPTDRKPDCWKYDNPGLWTTVSIRLDGTQHVREVHIDN